MGIYHETKTPMSWVYIYIHVIDLTFTCSNCSTSSLVFITHPLCYLVQHHPEKVVMPPPLVIDFEDGPETSQPPSGYNKKCFYLSLISTFVNHITCLFLYNNMYTYMDQFVLCFLLVYCIIYSIYNYRPLLIYVCIYDITCSWKTSNGRSALKR